MHDCTFRNKHGRDTFNSNIVTIGSNHELSHLMIGFVNINYELEFKFKLGYKIQSDFLSDFLSFLPSLSDHIGPPSCFNNSSNFEEL
jgi:hypothetical protein